MSENVRLTLLEAISYRTEQALKHWLQDPTHPMRIARIAARIQYDNPVLPYRNPYRSIQLDWILDFVRLLTTTRPSYLPPPGGSVVGEITFHYANSVWTIEYATGNNFPFRLWRDHTVFDISHAPFHQTLEIIAHSIPPPPAGLVQLRQPRP
jgi:hypothetical protein